MLLLDQDELIIQVVLHFWVYASLRRQDVQRCDDRLAIGTNLLEAYTQRIFFMGKHLPAPFYLKGLTRISLRYKTFREVVANILVHRKYTNARLTFFYHLR